MFYDVPKILTVSYDAYGADFYDCPSDVQLGEGFTIISTFIYLFSNILP